MAAPPDRQHAILGDVIGPDILRTFGLPPGTLSVQITIGVGAFVELRCRCLPSAESLDACATVLRRYRLVEVEPSPEQAGESRE